ncbi:MAG TPA: hypothetical protein VF789_18060 [Thermoanaerobaculia bacterium]
MSKYRSLAVTVSLCALICGLAAGSAWARTKGKIKKGTYTSPAGNFSVPLPDGLGLRVNDGYDPKEGIGAVSFHDDFGNQKGIHFMRIPADVTKVFEDPATRKQALEGFLEQAALPTWFLPVAKDTQILHQELFPLDGADAFIGLVSIPGGGTVSLSVPGSKEMKRADSTRGVLILYHGGYVYLLTTEVGGGAFSFAGRVPSRETQIATARETLPKFYATIRFDAPRR